MVLIHSGDPRRPYPQDIEMRSGLLGRLSMGITDLPETIAGVQQTMGDISISTAAATANGHSGEWMLVLLENSIES